MIAAPLEDPAGLYDGISFGSVTALNSVASTANGVVGAVATLIASTFTDGILAGLFSVDEYFPTAA